MKSIKTIILGREASAKCDFSGRDNTECFIVQAGMGQPQRVAANKLLELLRWNCSIAIPSSPEPPTKPREEKNNAAP